MPRTDAIEGVGDGARERDATEASRPLWSFASACTIYSGIGGGKTSVGSVTTHYCLRAVRQDEGLELEVADPKDEVGEGEARKTEGKDELKLERLQCR